ncbi:MAG: NAD-dependent epimerase/dehydratase family protein [Gemmataceae bacterium]
MAASPKRVLITGSAGRVGQAAVREIKARGHFVRGFDLAPTPGIDDFLVSDITDAAMIRRAVDGIDTLIHLAAIPDDDDFLTKLLPNNVIGVYHVFEAARLAGVRRLILGSSGQVVWYQRFTGPLPIGVDAQPTPRAWYAVAKVFLEAAGRSFADSHGMSVIAARLGWCPRTREHCEELARTEWGPDVYLSPGDAGRFFACAVEAPANFQFAVVYACSRPVTCEVYDLKPGKELLGYEPKDTWPAGVEDMLR